MYQNELLYESRTRVRYYKYERRTQPQTTRRRSHGCTRPRDTTTLPPTKITFFRPVICTGSRLIPARASRIHGPSTDDLITLTGRSRKSLGGVRMAAHGRGIQQPCLPTSSQMDQIVFFMPMICTASRQIPAAVCSHANAAEWFAVVSCAHIHST